MKWKYLKRAKRYIIKIKKLLERFKGRVGQAEERISKFEDSTIEIIKSRNRYKKIKENKQNLKNPWKPQALCPCTA